MRSTRGSTTKTIVTDGQAVSTFATTSCLLRHGKCFGSGERKGKDGPNRVMPPSERSLERFWVRSPQLSPCTHHADHSLQTL